MQLEGSEVAPLQQQIGLKDHVLVSDLIYEGVTCFFDFLLVIGEEPLAHFLIVEKLHVLLQLVYAVVVNFLFVLVDFILFFQLLNSLAFKHAFWLDGLLLLLLLQVLELQLLLLELLLL